MIFCHPPLLFVALILLSLQIILIYFPPSIQLFLLTLDAFPLLPIPTFLLTLDAFPLLPIPTFLLTLGAFLLLPIPSFLLILVQMFAPESILPTIIPLSPILPLLNAYLTLR